MNEKNIRELALEAAQGSAPAFQELYRLTRQGAWFVALSIAKNEHDAQDILQESYLKAYKNMGRLDKPESFVSWLNQIVANQAKNYIARKKPDSFAEFGDENAQDWQEETNPEFIPDEHLDRAEAKALIASLVSGLPEDQRLVVLLRYYDDMEVAAIAEALEIPEGTVKSRLARARNKLAAMLEQAQGKGLKLYAMAPIPLLAYFIKLLGFDAPGSDRLPPLLLGTAAAGSAAAGGAAAAGAARKAALAGKLGALSGKAAAFAAAGVVAVGGITAAGIYAYNKASLPAVVTTAPATETAADASAETHAAPDQFPTVLIPGSDWTQAPADTRAPAAPPPTSAPLSRADNPSSAAGAQETTQAPSTASTTTTETTTPRSTSATTRSTASTTRAPFSLPSFPTFTTRPRIATTQPKTTASTPETTTEPPISITEPITTTTGPTTTTEPATTTEPITTTEPVTTTEPITTTKPVTTTEPTTDKPDYEDFEYKRDPVGGYVITKYNGSQTHVVVPAMIDGVAVVHLGASIFEGMNVVRVEISPGIDCIRDKTFANCPDLKEVIVPPSVVTMNFNNSFSGSPNVVIVCTENSRAHRYAVANRLSFKLV